jgi:hypothetical protein
MTPNPPSESLADVGGNPETGIATPLVPSPLSVPARKPSSREAGGWLSGWLILCLVVLALFAGSFPPLNSDLWLRLATGRLVVDGGWQPGVDPFSYTTEGASWVNHSWLFDAGSYLCYRFLGSWSLVALRALLVAALALLVLGNPFQRRPATGPVVVAALMLVALAPWLQLRPECVSLFLFALTLAFLLRIERGNQSTFRAYLPLLVLFALWANVDGWFFLGPLALALHCLGFRLSRREETAAGGRASPLLLSLVALAGFVVCLANPHLWRVFALPAQLGLSPAAAVLGQDSLGRHLHLSPLQRDFYHPFPGFAIAAAASLLLAAVCLQSFLGRSSGWFSWQFVLWLGLLVLGLYQARALAFFAVASAAFACANLGAAVPDPVKGASPWRRTAPQFLAVCFPVILLAAWPGWLQGRPYGARSWRLAPSESARRVAARMEFWRQKGTAGPEARFFNFSPELGNHLAWAAPDVRMFFDSRLDLYSRQTALDYLAVRRVLLAQAGIQAGIAHKGREHAQLPTGASDAEEWRTIFRRHRIRYLLLTDPDRRRRLSVFSALVRDPAEWSLLAVEGEVAVFGWTDGGRYPFPRAQHGLEQAALFLDHAPGVPEGPPRDARQQTWVEPFWRSARTEAPDREEALYHLAAFDAMKRQRGDPRQAWEVALSAGLVASAGTGLPQAATLGLRFYFLAVSLMSGPGTPEEGLVLMWRALDVERRLPATPVSLQACIHAGRRAVRADPDDERAWLVLGAAYLHLLQDTQEKIWSRAWPLLREVRRAQASAALRQALLRQPDLAAAHLRLVGLYEGEPGLLDLTLKHLRAFREARFKEGEPTAQTDRLLEQLEERVAGRRKLYNRDAARLRIVDRARSALRLGLGGKALELLEESDYAAFGPQGAQLQLELQLLTGKARDAEENLRSRGEESPEPILRRPLGSNTYRSLVLRAALALGDYDRADDILAAPDSPAGSHVWEVEPRLRATIAVEVAAALVPPAGGLGSLLLETLRGERANRAAESLREMADGAAQRGLVALEAGDGNSARTWFAVALRMHGTPEQAATGSGLDFPGRPLAQAWAKILDASVP